MRDKWVASLSLCALFIVLAVVIGRACLTADTSNACVEVSEGVMDCNHPDYP